MKDRWSSRQLQQSRRKSLRLKPPTIEEENVELEQLKTRVPDATPAEHKRFLKACNGDLEFAVRELQDYLKWREENDLNSAEDSRDLYDDKDDWSHACTKALKIMANDPDDVKKSFKKSRVQNPNHLPRIARVYYDENNEPMKAKDGTMIVQVLSPKLDKTLASNECYALAMAFYLDRKFDRASLEYGTLLIDIRGDEGWPNPSAKHLLPFVQEVAKMLPKVYPERLRTCLVYPVPRMASFLFKMFKPLLPKDTAEKIKLVNGSAAIGAPVPKGLSEHVDEGAIDQLESGRQEKQTVVNDSTIGSSLPIGSALPLEGIEEQ